MSGLLNLILRGATSLLIAILALLSASTLFNWSGMGLSLDFIDMLGDGSPSAWLLLALATAIVFVALARVRPFRRKPGLEAPPTE